MPPWNLDGNKGTNPNKDFLGTTDNQPLSIRTNRQERLRVNTDGSLRVGPMQVTPQDNVNEGGEIALLGAGSNPHIYIDNFAGSFRVMTPSAVPLQIAPNGNIGIGTPTPGAKLEINDGDLLFKAAAEDPGDIVFQSSQGAQKGRIWSHVGSGAGLFLSSGDNTARITIAGDGRVGIGTASPARALDIAESSGSTEVVIRDNAQPSDQRVWRFMNNSRILAIQAMNDALSGGVSVMEFTRDGNIQVGGDILLTGADCAEDFDVSGAEELEPGTTVVIDQEGRLRQSCQAYDKRVAGVVSGGGDYRAGIVLDRRDAKADRMPVALMGKVGCKVDAECSSIEVGDLLTTSPTPGHAMKAEDTLRSTGTVLGKALRSLRAGREIIPVLVTLQ